MAPIHIVCLDVIELKAIVARFGHAVGDRVLIGVANVFRAELDDINRAGRVGPDEFAVFVEDATRREAEREAERLVRAIRHNAPSCNGEAVPVEIVFGIHTARAGENSAAALERAEREAFKARKKFRR